MPDWKSILTVPYTPLLELGRPGIVALTGTAGGSTGLGAAQDIRELGVIDLLVIRLAADAVSQGQSPDSAHRGIGWPRLCPVWSAKAIGPHGWRSTAGIRSQR